MSTRSRLNREYRRTITRARIYQIITSNPGISLGGIKREYEKDGFSRVWRVGLWWHRRAMGREGCGEGGNTITPEIVYIILPVP